MQAFNMLGLGFAWLMLAFIAMPIVNVMFGALGGYIVQIFVGGWVVSGAAELGLRLDPTKLWQIGAALAWFGTYFRVPARHNSSKTVEQTK